jgi:signal transduction histidine kinase
MRHSWTLWLAFVACLAVALAAMGWVSVTALRLDQAETQARRQAALEESAGLALWRMDSALAPMLGQESARPAFVYRTFLPADRAYARAPKGRTADSGLAPSPLLSGGSPQVLVYVQFEPDGQITSPRVPTGAGLRRAVPKYLSQEAVQKARSQLDRVRAIADRAQLLAMLPQTSPALGEISNTFANQYATNFAGPEQFQLIPQGQSRQAIDFNQRSQAVMQNANTMVQAQNDADWLQPVSNIDGAALMKPLWVGGELLLVRRVLVGGQPCVQGCLLDWPAIRESLLGLVRDDLLPEANLERVLHESEDGQSRRLAALPARLVPGSVVGGFEKAASPVWLPLGVAWGCFLTATAAVASLLGGVIRLSERRAAFVSAVTHELRTPLTTFHMYTEMLSEGMVADVAEQKHYLNTLRVEASRLSHLVENVLAYARLERGRIDGHVEALPVGRIVDACRGRLADRASGAGMELVVEAGDAALATVVRANPSAAEQVLFNLVDNACKYAAAADDKRIHFAVDSSRDEVRLRVRDHGPGIAAAVRGRLFRPFSKSAREAAHSAPGVGLGLALSRRLAQDMGGQLRLEESPGGGACFALTLPTAR